MVGIIRLCFYFPVCFLQFPPHLRAGVKHFLSKTSPSSDKYAQYPKPPCAVQVLHLVLTITLVQPPNTHSALPPPCFAQRPLRLELVVHPATEHGFFPPPCLEQCGDPDCALLVHPANLHVPRAPCLLQTPRACARVVQPSSLHTFLLPPPCLPHRPRSWTALVHLLNEQVPCAPCLPQTPRPLAMVLQPSVEHATVLLSCFPHFP